MPELPEVETIRENLRTGRSGNPSILGKTIHKARVLWSRTLATPSLEKFQALIPGQTIVEIQRRGKYLVFQLSRDFLLIHLRMSGDLLVEPARAPLHKHHRLTLTLLDASKKLRLAFNDPRKFGRVWLVSDPDEVLAPLGPEPLGSEFTAQYLYQNLIARRRQLKPLLMDQTFLAGLGNIYTDEALHLAGLHPLTRSNTITEAGTKRLWEAIRHVLLEGMRYNGASIDWVFRGGDFQNHFRVYDRKGKNCYTCGSPIQRIVVGQRGTYLCPQCQVLLIGD